MVLMHESSPFLMNIMIVNCVRLWTMTLCVLLLPLLPSLAGEPNAKALKYHQLLRKRPNSGYVFDRFYDSWLDSASTDELEVFLRKSAESGKSGDQRLLGYYFIRQGKEVEALRIYHAALKQAPEDVTLRLEKAKLEARLLNFDAAVRDLEAALPKAADQQLLEIERLRGRYLARSGRFDDAAKVWKKLLESEPDDAELMDSILELQLAEGLFAEALTTSAMQIEKASDAYQKVIHTLRRGDVYQRAGKRQKAIETYVGTLDLVGEDSWLEREILAQLQEIHRREDDIEGLKKLYLSLSEKFPQRIGIRKAHVRLLASLDEGDKAEELFREILKITPGNRQNREELIAILLKTGKHESALEEIDRLIKAHPEEAKLQLLLAATQFKAGKKEAVPATLDRFLELNKSVEGAELQVATLLQKYGFPELAEQQLRASLKEDPDNMIFREALVRVLVELKRKDEALVLWKEMIAEGTRETVLRQTLAIKKAGETDLAYQLLQSRAEDFKIDPVYLKVLVEEAMIHQDFDRAAEWARSILALSRQSEEMRQAVMLNTRVALKAERELGVAESLEMDTSRSPSESWLLAALYEAQGQSAKAEGTMKEMQEDHPEIAAIAEVSLFEQRGDWLNAAQAMERLIVLPKGKKSLYLRRLVDFYVRLDETEKALKHLETWKQMARGDKAPWFKQAAILNISGKSQEAIQVLRRAANQFEGDPDFRARLAVLYQEQGEFANAERHFERLYEESEKLDDRLRWVPLLAQVAEDQGKGNDLIARFEERQRSNPKSIEPLLALAEIYRFNENYELRRKAMMKAARLRPDDPEILLVTANMEEREGDTDRAEESLLKAAELDKTNKSKEALARFYFRYDEIDKGITLVRELARDQGGGVREMENAAVEIARSGEFEAALELVDEAIAAYGGDYRLGFLRAILLAGESRTDEAISQLLVVLDMNADLSGVSPIKTPEQWRAAFENGIFRAPAHLQYMFCDASGAELMKRPDSNQVRISGSQSMASFSLPGDLSEKRALTEGALLYLYGKLEEAEQQRMLPQLTAAGIHRVEYRQILLNTSGDGGPSTTALKAYVRKHPDEQGVAFFPVMMESLMASFLPSENKVDTEFLRFVQKKVKDPGPFISFIIQIQLAQSSDHEVSDEAWNRALESAGKIREGDVLIPALIFAAAMAESDDIEFETQRKLLDQAVKWYTLIEASPTQMSGYLGGSLFNVIVNQYAKAEQKEELLAFLEKVCATYAALPASAAAAGNLRVMPMFGSQAEEALPLPPFPPKESRKLAPSVLTLLSESDDDSSGFGLMGMPEGDPLDMDSLELDKFLDKVTNPYLAIHIADFYGNEATVAELIDQINSAEQASLEAILYKAGFLSASEDYVAASALLAKVRFLPMRRAKRAQIDKYLTALSLKLLSSEKEENHAAAIDEGKRAALRLRRSVKSSGERAMLISALDDLGLQKAADLLASTSAPSAGLGGSMASGSSDIDKLKSALEKGEKEKAERLALRAVKYQVQRPGDYSSNRERASLRALLEKHKMVGPIIKKLKPDESVSPRRLANFAYILLFFEKRDEGVALLEELVQNGLKDEKAHLLLAFALPAGRVADAAKQLGRYLDKAGNPGRTIGFHLQSLEESREIDPWLDAFAVIVRYLKGQQPDDQLLKRQQKNGWWVRDVGDMLIGRAGFYSAVFVGSDERIPSILSPEYAERLEKSELHYLRKHLMIAQELLETSIHFPELVDWAFPRYDISLAVDGRKVQRKKAMLALENVIRSRKNKQPNRMDLDADEQVGRFPLLVIAEDAMTTGPSVVFSDEFLAGIKKLDEQESRSLRVLQSLLYVDEAELESAIQTHIESGKKDGEQGVSPQLGKVLVTACVARTSISPAVEEWLGSEISTKKRGAYLERYRLLTAVLADYLLLLEKKAPSRIAPLLGRVIVSLVQPKGELAEVIQNTEENSYSMTGGIPDQAYRLHFVSELFDGMGAKEDFSMIVHLVRAKLTAGFQSDQDYYELSRNADNSSVMLLDDVMETFDHASFGELRSDEELGILSFGDTEVNLFGRLVQIFAESMSSEKSAIYLPAAKIKRMLLELKGPKKLFFQLALMVQKDIELDKDQLVQEVLSGHRETIRGWSPGMSQWFVEQIRSSVISIDADRDLRLPENYSKESKEVIKGLLRSLGDARMDQLEAIAELEVFEDFNELSKVSELFGYHGASLLEMDREKFVAALARAADLKWALLFDESKVAVPFDPFAPGESWVDLYEVAIHGLRFKNNGDVIRLMHDVLNAQERASLVIPKCMPEIASMDLNQRYSDRLDRIDGLARNPDPEIFARDHVKALLDVLAAYEKLPESHQQIAALSVAHYLLTYYPEPLSVRKLAMAELVKLDTKSPSLIKKAATAGLAAGLVKLTAGEEQCEAIAHVASLYRSLSNAQDRYGLTRIIAASAGEVFCDDALQALAYESIDEVFESDDCDPDYYPYPELAEISGQKASTLAGDQFLKFFNQFKVALRKKERAGYRSRRVFASKSFISENRDEEILFALALRSGDAEALEYVIKRHKSKLVGSHVALRGALRYRRADIADELWQVPSVELLAKSDRFRAIAMTSGLMDRNVELALKEFIKLSPDDLGRAFLRDCYFTLKSTCDPDLMPLENDESRCKSVIEGGLAGEKYNGREAAHLVTMIMINGGHAELGDPLDDVLSAMIRPLVARIVGELLKETGYQVNHQVKRHHRELLSLYFRKLVEEDDLEELKSVLKAMLRASRSCTCENYMESLLLATRLLEGRLFKAIDAGDAEGISHCREYLEVIAAPVITYPRYSPYWQWGLPVALHALSYVYGEEPEGYRGFLKRQMTGQKQKAVQGFDVFHALKFARYGGNLFFDSENKELQLRVLKKVIDAGNQGMFDAAAIYSSKGYGLAHLKRWQLIDSEMLMNLNLYVETVKLGEHIQANQMAGFVKKSLARDLPKWKKGEDGGGN